MKKKARNTPDLIKIIYDFAATHPEWRTSQGARDECVRSFELFSEYLKSKRLSNIYKIKYYEFDLTTGSNTLPKVYIHKRGLSEQHCVVSTRDYLIDFTAKQYSSKLPYPFIIPRSILRPRARPKN